MDDILTNVTYFTLNAFKNIPLLFYVLKTIDYNTFYLPINK